MKTPRELYLQAEEEFPDNHLEKVLRYNELMVEHGHIIPREEGDDSPLLACGYDPRERDERNTFGGETDCDQLS